ncbi:hypothetical protein DL771_007446 [Monosporascus sp. 5C6A]|nr:hypothetical protein DL771_007446 [Monosporascus sp. 5C6A]
MPKEGPFLYYKLSRKWDSKRRDVEDGASRPDGGALEEFEGFNGVFCTDADSNLGKGCLRLLMEALARDKNAIAAACTVFVGLEPGFKWSFWSLHQQFQYTFSQFVQRRAEGHIGKVTCLPGCVTMIAVHKESDRRYPEQGTERRLTFAMLSQGHNLSTLFVPKAVSETVAPHYFSLGGKKMSLIIRVAAASDTAPPDIRHSLGCVRRHCHLNAADSSEPEPEPEDGGKKRS